MKIGFSFGRCVNDIVQGNIDINDVLLIVCRTHMEEKTHMHEVVSYYCNDGYIKGSYEDAIAVAYELWERGKLHQPRIYGVNPKTVDIKDLWMDLAPTLQSDDENLKEAWRNYQMLMRLTSDEKPTTPRHLG